MSYSQLNKDAKYTSQDADPQYRTEGDEFSMASERFSLTEQGTSEVKNRMKSYNLQEEEAIENGDMDVVEEIKRQRQRNLRKEFDSSIKTPLIYLADKVNTFFQDEPKPDNNPENLLGIDIEKTHIESVQKRIQVLDKELSKVRGFWNNLKVLGGTAYGAVSDPFVLATLPLGTARVGTAAVGATVSKMIGANAMKAMAQEFGIAALAEVFIQSSVYEYNQKIADPSKGIKRMDVWDAANNVLFNSFMAAGFGGTLSAGADLAKIGYKGKAQFMAQENIASFTRTKDASGVDEATITDMLKHSTFDQKVDPSVVSEIVKLINTSPQADIRVHAANIDLAGKQIDEKGFVNLKEDFTVPASEAQVGDTIGIRVDQDSYIADIIKSDENTVTFKLGDEEVTIFRETGLSADGKVYEAAVDMKPYPKNENVNNIDPISTEEELYKQTPKSEVDALQEQYADNIEIIEINNKTADIEKILGLSDAEDGIDGFTPPKDGSEVPKTEKPTQPTTQEKGVSPAMKDAIMGEEDPALTKAFKDIDETPAENLTSHKDFNTLEDAIKNPPKLESTRESNPQFKERIEAMDSEDEINAAWQERMQSGVDTTDVGYSTPQLGKKDLKEINAGKGTPEQLEMLREDLKLMQSDNYKPKELPPKEEIEINADGDIVGADGNVLFAKGIPELFGGSVTGIEQDENGNWSIDPAKFVIGMLLGHTAKRIGKLGLDPKVQADILRVLETKTEDLVKQYPMLDVIPKLYVGSKAKGFKEAQAAGKTIGDTADKQEKFWIDDIGAEMKPLKDDQVSFKLDEVIDHPELFKQYPELKDIRVSKGKTSYYSPQLKHIKIGKQNSADAKVMEKYETEEQKIYDKYENIANGKELTDIQEAAAEKELNNLYAEVRSNLTNKKVFDKSTLLHEVQHAIQETEGFAKGGSAEGIKEVRQAKLSVIEKLNAFNDRFGFSDWLDENYSKYTQDGKIKFNAEMFKQMENDFAMTLSPAQNQVYKQMRSDLEYLNSQDGTKVGESDFEAYQRLAGEQEARATQAALKHPELDPYAALVKEEGKLQKPIVKMDGDGVSNLEYAGAKDSV